MKTHGLAGTYAKGCRCRPCKKAAREWRQDRYRRDPPPAPLRNLREGTRGAKAHDDRIDELLRVLAG